MVGEVDLCLMSAATQTVLVMSSSEQLGLHTELRHLPAWSKARLGQLLGDNRSHHWQAVMSSIPHTPPWQPGMPLPHQQNYPRKYTAEEVKLLENELSIGLVNSSVGSGINLLLEEWSCSGIIRPTISDLINLFERHNLLVASSFLRRELLRESSTDGGTQTFKELDRLMEETNLAPHPEHLSEEAGASAAYCDQATLVIANIDGDAELDNLIAEQNITQVRNVTTSKLNLSQPSATSFQTLDRMSDEAQRASSSDADKKNTIRPPVEFDASLPIAPHISYDFLHKITDGFSNTPYSCGGRKLGEGAFGVVYKADISIENFEKENNASCRIDSLLTNDSNAADKAPSNGSIKQLAIKKLNFADDRVDKQFKIEVEILSQCNHKNILPLEGYSCDGPHWCLLYAFMMHGNLQDRLACQGNIAPLTYVQRIIIGHGSAEGLAYLHTFRDKPLIHRDVKSANILLDADLHPRIGDFGLMRTGGSGSHTETLAKTTTVFGTSAYMAPEAFRGDVSAKLDTFSYGVVLLEILTGLPPYDEERDGRDLLSHIEGTDEPADALCDTKAAPWPPGLPQDMLSLATLCFEERKSRPTMVDVASKWKHMVDKCSQ